MAKRIQYSLFFLIAYFFYFHFYYISSLYDFRSDFHLLIQSAKLGLETGSFYLTNYNLNTPVFNLIFSTLTKLPWPANAFLWGSISLSALTLTLMLINETLDLPHPLIFFSLAWFSFPTLNNLLLAQAGFIAALFTVVLWQKARVRQEGMAGSLLGIMLSFKLFFGLFFLFFLFQKRWKLLITAGLVFLLLNAFSIAIYGVDTYWEYYQLLKHVSWQAHIWNGSFIGALDRIMGGSRCPGFTGWQLPLLKKALLIILVLTTLYSLINATLKIKNLYQFDVIYALFSCGMFLLSPLGWVYYFPCLILAYAIILHYSEKCCNINLILLFAIAGLTAFNYPLLLTATETGREICLQIESFQPYQFVFLFGLVSLFASLSIMARERILHTPTKIAWLIHWPLLIIGVLCFLIAYLTLFVEINSGFEALYSLKSIASISS